MVTTECGISHKNTKHEINEERKNKNNTDTIRRNERQILLQNTVQISMTQSIHILIKVRATKQ